jgi:nucleoside-diphosphate-sugar epimerase
MMKVLFIGGTGNISTACTQIATSKGMEVYHFNRQKSTSKTSPESVKTITGDIHSAADRKKINKFAPFDVVANFIAFIPDQVKADIAQFTTITKQYIFISSATVYKKPPDHYIITEECPLENPFWEYARNKIACEQLLRSQHKMDYTIVRPSYTYSESWIPVALTARSYSPVFRIKNGLPIISHGDGESLWVNTHAHDFARAFVGLFGNSSALNNHFHITSDEVLTWDQIYHIIGKVIGKVPYLIHIPSDFINRYDPDWGAGLLGDKARSVVFDNSKIKSAIPGWKAEILFAEGIRQSIAWFEAKPARMKLNREIELKMDSIIKQISKL